MISDGCSPANPGDYPSDCQLTEALRTRAMKRNAPVERTKEWQAALGQAQKVKLLLLDVDGVLTNGSLVYTGSGEEAKCFHTQDGLGIKLLQESGIEVGIITARNSSIVARRAEELKITHVYQGKFDKLSVYEEVLKKTGLRPMHTAYMGDDWVDLPLLNRVGFAAAPANARVEIQQRVHYLTKRNGGQGAVREVCDLIMESQGTYQQMFARFDR
ncbi:HAD family hydrolase [Desulfogranum marinum]|uniref:KdsC family phosphatase n=1 Tax=Desulfogranum marinum TaxID=453220 RepID=UPI001962EC64|nr:HAD-IIIA family hydrolase [Desulfogranum marinum]MBM9514443.1 HAD-IIIA family hydrolase [Desulfogranum marinum]